MPDRVTSRASSRASSAFTGARDAVVTTVRWERHVDALQESGVTRRASGEPFGVLAELLTKTPAPVEDVAPLRLFARAAEHRRSIFVSATSAGSFTALLAPTGLGLDLLLGGIAAAVAAVVMVGSDVRQEVLVHRSDVRCVEVERDKERHRARVRLGLSSQATLLAALEACEAVWDSEDIPADTRPRLTEALKSLALDLEDLESRIQAARRAGLVDEHGRLDNVRATARMFSSTKARELLAAQRHVLDVLEVIRKTCAAVDLAASAARHAAVQGRAAVPLQSLLDLQAEMLHRRDVLEQMAELDAPTR